jgi:hypothetical protein
MQVTEVRIRLANEEFVKAYASFASTIVFWSTTSGLSKVPLVFSSHLLIGRTARAVSEILLFRLTLKRQMIEQALLAEYEKVRCGKRESEDRLRTTGQLSYITKHYSDSNHCCNRVPITVLASLIVIGVLGGLNFTLACLASSPSALRL